MVLQKKIRRSQQKQFPQDKIGIVVDDVCSLPNDIIKKNKIEVVKIKLYFKEMEENPEKDIYQIMKETRASPKTSAPSPGQFIRAYKQSLKAHNKIIVITVSSKLSGTLNVAFQARKLMPDPSRIEIIDSGSAVAAEGLFALKILGLIKKGKDLKDIKRILQRTGKK